MIGSAAGFTFFDFIVYDAPVVVVILAIIIGIFYVMFGRKMNVGDQQRAKIMELVETDYIKNPRLFKISIAMICLVVIGFMLHGTLGIESSVVAMTGRRRHPRRIA